MESIPLSSGKESDMPKKPVFPESNNYIVIYCDSAGSLHAQEYIGAKVAIDGYRYLRKLYGDNVRLAKVVLNYGTKI